MKQIYLELFIRKKINDTAWNQCIDKAHNALVYGHTWYLDAVTNVPGWRWEGLVLHRESGPGYAAVMPVPLRKRWGRWVIYQPLFCQFLAIFSEYPLDPAPFLEALGRRYRYASSLNLLLDSSLSTLPHWVQVQTLFTHVLPLTSPCNRATHQPIPYVELVGRYSPDRQMNLRRAIKRTSEAAHWQLTKSENTVPLLALFRANHADSIGVGEWAYNLFRGLFVALQQQGLGTLYYACVEGEPVAGALFVEANGRIIYLFNTANAEGRHLNARTLLLDRVIEEATKKATADPLLFDFESPEKPGIVKFYASFGAVPQAYMVLNWSRLTWVEKALIWVKSRVQSKFRLLNVPANNP